MPFLKTIVKKLINIRETALIQILPEILKGNRYILVQGCVHLVLGGRNQLSRQLEWK